MAKTAAERQRERRARLKEECKKPVYVRGNNGELDERFRIALAVKELVKEQAIPKEIIELIIKKSETVFPDKTPLKRKFINKIVSEYLYEDS